MKGTVIAINYRSRFERKIHRWIADWKRQGYPDDIPDEADAYLESIGKAPSYRRICLAILRNDMALTSLGFGVEKCPTYMELKRIEIQARSKKPCKP